MNDEFERSKLSRMERRTLYVKDALTGSTNLVDVGLPVLLTSASVLARAYHEDESHFERCLDLLVRTRLLHDIELVTLSQASKRAFLTIRDELFWLAHPVARYIRHTASDAPDHRRARAVFDLVHHITVMRRVFETVVRFSGGVATWELPAPDMNIVALESQLGFRLSIWLVSFWAVHNGQPDTLALNHANPSLINGLRLLLANEVPTIAAVSLPLMRHSLDAAGAHADRCVPISPLPMGGAGQQLWVDTSNDAVYMAMQLNAVRVARSVKEYLRAAVS